MFKRNLCYEASAGSGKTFMLVVRYLSLLFQGADPSKILALTFTNKAASEMSQRVVETLQDLEHRGELHEIARVTELSLDEILEKKDALLHAFLNANTKIMTIDSFFTHILRKFSLYAALMPDFSTASAQHQLKLLSRFLSETTVANKRNTLITLSLAYSRRIGDIFALLDELYVKKEELADLRFTRIDSRSYEAEALQALKGIAKLVDSCKEASATLKSAVVAADFEALLQKSWVMQESLDYWVFKKCYKEEMDLYLRVIQEAVLSHFRAKESNFFYALKELLGIYVKSKKALYVEDSELSFSDVSALVYEILHNINDSEFLYFRLDAQIEHILLDEFQDTSILQYEILEPLISEITSKEDGSFFFVGDVKQSIYRFRGGISALFEEVAWRHGTQKEKLLTNYRSRQEIVHFVNSVFEERINAYTPQLVRDEAKGGYVAVIRNDALLDEVLVQVQRLISLGAELDTIAILCATNRDGEEIKFALEEAGIAVVTETTTKLINQKSVRALLEYLKYLYFKEEIYRENFFALLNREPSVLAFVDLSNKRLLDIVKGAIDRYGLFEDFHIIRFLDVLRRYDDIEALLFEYEREETTAAASEIHGVRVLTIHKSKGLEYEHVIVLDRLHNPPPTRSTIIYEYDGIKLQNLYLRTKDREKLDNAYKNAIDKEKALQREDKLNAFYVAFTRARETLLIIQKSEKSDFELLNMNECSYGELHIKMSENSVQVPKKKLHFKEHYYGTQEEILSMQQESVEHIEARHFGSALHYTLEMMESFERASLGNALDMLANKYGFLLTPTQQEEIATRVKSLLDDSGFKDLSDGICYREKGMLFGAKLRYIDLLVEKQDGSFYVIDYKSSKAFADEHFKQVRSYVNAVKSITHKEVHGYLCYLLADSVEIQRVL